MNSQPFKFLMISAMYENGGNTTQRTLDGHPNLFVYPFESQPGTKFVNDFLSSMFPLKYRWPIFPVSATTNEMYKMIIDEEGKVRARTPFVSKFRDADISLSDDERQEIFVKILEKKELSRANIMEAFFRATFEAWKNVKKTGKEQWYVGYSPIIGVDADKIIKDYKGNGVVLHVIRNPFSAYADTKKRAVPLSLDHYVSAWMINQYYALNFARKFPKDFFILRFEDLIVDKKKALQPLFKRMKIDFHESQNYQSWNGEKLEEIYPWGTIRIATPEMNLKTAKELNNSEIDEIYSRVENYIKNFGYESIYKKLK